MTDVEQQISDLEVKKGQFDPMSISYYTDVAAIDQQIMTLKGQLQAEQDKQERIQAQEEKINGSITFNVDGVDMSKLPAEMIKLINVVVKHDRKHLFEEQNKEFSALQEKHRAELETAKEESLNWQKQCREAMEARAKAEDRAAEVDRLNAELIAKNGQLEIEAKDYDQRLRNAAQIIQEKDADIERLNRLISDNAAASHFGERAAQQIIDITPDAEDDVQSLVNSIAAQFAGLDDLKKSTDDWGTVIKVNKPDGTFERLNRDQYEEIAKKLEAPVLSVEVQPVGESFPVENPAINAENGGVLDPQVDEVSHFRPEETLVSVHQPSDIGGVVPEAFAKRLEALEVAVFGTAKVVA